MTLYFVCSLMSLTPVLSGHRFQDFIPKSVEPLVNQKTCHWQALMNTPSGTLLASQICEFSQ